MSEETSAGGVVIFGNAILLLRKYNGDYVLPKGKVEINETIEEAALREVLEETKVRARVIDYLGKVDYTFRSTFNKSKGVVDKRVYWFLMVSKNLNARPQKEEGFVDAIYVTYDKALKVIKYRDEKAIIKKAIDRYKVIKEYESIKNKRFK